MEKAKEYLQSTVSHLVDNHDQVQIDSRVDDLGVLITLKVAKDDMGKIIGKAGSTAQAIRTILRAIGMRENARVNLRIEEPEGSTRRYTNTGGDRDQFN